MLLIDTHSHIYLDDFKDDREQVIQHALDHDVRYILLPNIDSETSGKVLQLAHQFPAICFPMMGLHPTSVKENYKEEMHLVESLLKQHGFYAIGETGIDLYWDQRFLPQQIEAFRWQIDLAIEYEIPIVIHCRNSFDEIMKVLLDYTNNMPKGVFHCFPGDLQQAQKEIDLGFYLGIGGVVSYKNSAMQKLVSALPLDQIILETDAPFLTPVPYRGKRNESAYILHIAQTIAQLKNISVKEVATRTTQNALTLFSFPTHAQ